MPFGSGLSVFRVSVQRGLALSSDAANWNGIPSLQSKYSALINTQNVSHDISIVGEERYYLKLEKIAHRVGACHKKTASWDRRVVEEISTNKSTLLSKGEGSLLRTRRSPPIRHEDAIVQSSELGKQAEIECVLASKNPPKEGGWKFDQSCGFLVFSIGTRQNRWYLCQFCQVLAYCPVGVVVFDYGGELEALWELGNPERLTAKTSLEVDSASS